MPFVGGGVEVVVGGSPAVDHVLAPVRGIQRGAGLVGRGLMLRARWLGRVPYREALALQEGLFHHGHEQHLLLLEHPHVFTHSRSKGSRP